MIFGRKKTTSNVNVAWNRSMILRKIAEECAIPGMIVNKDTFIFADNPRLKIKFITNQYSDDSKLELNGSLMFRVNGEDVFWVDILSVAKIKLGSNYRAMSIKKNAKWDGSSIQRETALVYKPLLEICSTEALTRDFLGGVEVRVQSGSLGIPDTDEYAWLRASGAEILAAINKQ